MSNDLPTLYKHITSLLYLIRSLLSLTNIRQFSHFIHIQDLIILLCASFFHRRFRTTYILLNYNGRPRWVPTARQFNEPSFSVRLGMIKHHSSHTFYFHSSSPSSNYCSMAFQAHKSKHARRTPSTINKWISIIFWDFQCCKNRSSHNYNKI